MTISLVIPFLNQLHDAKGAMGLLKHNTNPDVEWVVIDNGSTDPIEPFFRDIIKPKRLNYIRNEENVGMIKTMQQGYKESEGDIIAFLHNDVFVYQDGWDINVRNVFIDKTIGGVGFFGSQGCGHIGERIQDVKQAGQMAGLSNMLEAELHGMRMKGDICSDFNTHPVAIFDGYGMMFRREALDKAGGFDMDYIYHHLYDRDIALRIMKAGYRNVVIDTPTHHWGGMTANRAGYQTWINEKLPEHKGYIRPGETDPIGADMWTHDENTRIFKKKWADYLPLYVEDDFSLRETGSFNETPFTKKIWEK